MNIQKGPLLLAASWGAISVIIASFVTLIQPTQYVYQMTLSIFLAPLSFRPAYHLLCRIKTATFVVHKKKRQWLHLNPFLSTGNPGVKAINHYWHSLITTASFALSSPGDILCMSSHLLSPGRMAKLKRHFPTDSYHFHTIQRPIPKIEQIGLQVDTFLREWRWFTPAKSGGIVIIRRKKLSRLKK